MLSAATAAKSLQSCPTLCNPIDGSPPGSAIPGILQARTLEWVAISFSNAWNWKVKVKSLSHVRLSETTWTAAYQAPSSMGFSRQEYWRVMPSPSPNTGIDFFYFSTFLIGDQNSAENSAQCFALEVNVFLSENDQFKFFYICYLNKPARSDE